MGEEAWTAPGFWRLWRGGLLRDLPPGDGWRWKLLEMGYRWKRTRYVPTGKPPGRGGGGVQGGLEGGGKGGLRVFFLDESGFGSPCLPPMPGRGRGRRCGAAVLGEVGAGERGGAPGEASPGAGSWGTGFWRGGAGRGRWWPTWEGLSREVAREGVRGGVPGQRALSPVPGLSGGGGRWRERGLEVAYLPRYSPHLNPVEGVWRRVKGF